MTPERWRQVERVYRAALEREPSQRDAFVAGECQNDEELRREVESLLARDGSLPEHPATEQAELKPGSRLGRYEILERIGAGGMGKVYRARDTSLNRQVAIKVSDALFSSRFAREARALAVLNHPNICTIHDVGPDFLVMELVEGDTLADRIKRGALTIDEALPVAGQIAAALEAAHESGIVHRDLKPANIKIKPDGGVKVLDFGLATQKSERDPTDTTATMTALGTIVGTAAYMSPEQARGKPVDKRTDVWAFGAVLYEMVTGQRAFSGETTTDILAAVVNAEPDWGRLPVKVQRLVRACLEKDPERRLRHVDDFALLLDQAPPTARPAAKLPWAAIAAMLIIVAAGATWALWRAYRRPPEAAALATVRFTFTPAQISKGSNVDIDTAVFISSDGKHIAYVEAPSGQLWIRDLDQEQAHPVPGATNVYEAFWSPDDRFIGYSSGSACNPGAPTTAQAGCGLVKIPTQGGTPVLITKLAGGFRRASWSSDGETIVYCDGTGIYTVPAAGGSPTPVTEDPPFLDFGGNIHIEHPSFIDLPDGRRAILFQAVDAPQVGHAIYVQVMGEKRGRYITVSSSSNPYPAYSPTGHIVYADGSYDSAAIWALPFSLDTLQPTGKAFPIAQHGSSPRVSRTGTLVYSDVPTNHVQLAWSDRSGKTISTIGEPMRQESPSLSPDGSRLAVLSRENEIDMWLYDVDRGTKTRFTFDSAYHSRAAWTPSGDQIAYALIRNNNLDIFSKPSNGNGDAKLLVSSPLDDQAPDWSPDGRYLIYAASSRTSKSQLLYRDRRKDGSLGEPVVFLKTAFNHLAPRFSPDGRFVAYVSDESGKNEVYVRDFPSGANQWLISTDGGTAPHWRPDGKEIFYVRQGKLMAASVATHPKFTAGAPTVLFENRMLQIGYDVATDGKRFVVPIAPANEPPIAIHVVHNWFEEFRHQPRD